MAFEREGIFIVSVATALALVSAYAANAPPHAAPRTPVTVQPLPPVNKAAPPVVATPASPPVVRPTPAERPFMLRPDPYAWIALLDTFAASAATIFYLRNPGRRSLRLAAALTASSAVFLAAALLAWLA
jgi:hypothetical protein